MKVQVAHVWKLPNQVFKCRSNNTSKIKNTIKIKEFSDKCNHCKTPHCSPCIANRITTKKKLQYFPVVSSTWQGQSRYSPKFVEVLIVVETKSNSLKTDNTGNFTLHLSWVCVSSVSVRVVSLSSMRTLSSTLSLWAVTSTSSWKAEAWPHRHGIHTGQCVTSSSVHSS